MCGIAGIFNFNSSRVPERNVLEAMAEAMAHRGPDDSGVWLDEHAGFAHRRLSIVDLAHGHQPMSNAAGTVHVCFNGEIYNQWEIRKVLQKRGHTFKTTCDTEVLLALYEDRGEDMVAELNGMFAFAIYDSLRKRLFLVRDRLGQKPVYYFVEGGTLFFASELTALKVAPQFPGAVRNQSLHDYLTYQYVPAPFTIYERVFKLEPGSCISCAVGDSAAPQPRRYWHPCYAVKNTCGFRECSRQLRALLTDAVRARLMADVPLGAFLSGGIDSTAVVGIMSKLMNQPVQSFTIGFDEAKYDEQPFAAAAAAKFGTDHRTRIVNPQNFDVVQKLVRHYGEPFSDASMLPTFLLSSFTREHVKVALSGDGADELFGGYYRYLVMNYARLYSCLPLAVRRPVCDAMLRLMPPKTEERTTAARINRLLQLARVQRDDRYLEIIDRFPETLKHSVYGPRMNDVPLASSSEYLRKWFSATTSTHPVERVAEVDLHTYLPCDILTKVDIASMATSLEVRSPFMDYRMVEFAASLPWSFKQERGQRKRILLEACRDLLPVELQKRGKMGFGVPLARWFRGEWKGILYDVLLDKTTEERGFLSAAAMRTLIDEHVSLQADHSYSLWALLVFELWCREFRI